MAHLFAKDELCCVSSDYLVASETQVLRNPVLA